MRKKRDGEIRAQVHEYSSTSICQLTIQLMVVKGWRKEEGISFNKMHCDITDIKLMKNV